MASITVEYCGLFGDRVAVEVEGFEMFGVYDLVDLDYVDGLDGVGLVEDTD